MTVAESIAVAISVCTALQVVVYRHLVQLTLLKRGTGLVLHFSLCICCCRSGLAGWCVDTMVSTHQRHACGLRGCLMAGARGASGLRPCSPCGAPDGTSHLRGIWGVSVCFSIPSLVDLNRPPWSFVCVCEERHMRLQVQVIHRNWF